MTQMRVRLIFDFPCIDLCIVKKMILILFMAVNDVISCAGAMIGSGPGSKRRNKLNKT